MEVAVGRAVRERGGAAGASRVSVRRAELDVMIVGGENKGEKQGMILAPHHPCADSSRPGPGPKVGPDQEHVGKQANGGVEPKP